MIKALCSVVALGAIACGPSTKPAPITGDPKDPPAPTADADPFCDPLAKVIADTPNDYTNLRGELVEDDPDMGALWEATVVLGTSAEVVYLHEQQRASWTAYWKDDGQGMGRLRSLSEQIAACPVMASFTLDPLPDDQADSDPDARRVFTWQGPADGSGLVVELNYGDLGATLTIGPNG